MAGVKVYDGHTVLFGMDADTDPSELPVQAVAKAVNRTFRGGKNRTRPAFNEISLEFQSDSDRELFQLGNMQGAAWYNRARPGRKEGIVASIAGTIFYIVLVNERGLVYRIFEGNDPKRLHAFFCQAEEWMYIQDGDKEPIFWNGLVGEGAARRSLGTEGDEMPIGNLMCLAHGRIFVANEFNQIVASDVMFGKGFNKTDNVQKFTENQYWNEGGYFSFPSRLGSISGMIVMPQLGNNRGQGELIVVGTKGGQSFAVHEPRQQWKDLQIQHDIMNGRGCTAHDSLIPVNNDIWFRSDDGWSSFTLTRLDNSQKSALHKISREINNWLDQDTPHFQRYTSHIYHDNRILGTVSPFLSLPRTPTHGTHRYFRGIAALDMDTTSSALGGGKINYDGLWTGIRPTALIKGGERAFAFSFDADGVNRLYEITRKSGNDNGNKKIKSFYITKRFAFRPSGASEFQSKRATGGEFWISEVKDRVGASVQYRTNNSPCWNEYFSLTRTGCDGPKGPNIPLSRPGYKRWKMGTPDPDQCEQGGDNLACVGTEFQFLVRLEGSARIDRMRVMSETTDDSDQMEGDCPDSPECEGECEEITCEIENDYEYLIVNG
jgi:hypothetical protein